MSEGDTGPALRDPLLVYASRHASIDPELIRICGLDNRQLNDSAAREAYEKFRRAADQGSAFAMCMCSRFSQAGWGRPQSNEETLKWAEQAAAAGFAPGHYELGKCYEQGIGVPADLDRARQCYEAASEGGFGAAAYHLAELYFAGKFGAPDVAKAIECAKWSDHLNEPMAALALAKWYEDGNGIVQDLKEALSWYVRAAELGNFFASFRLSMAYSLGDLGLQRDEEMAKKYEAMCSSQTQ